MLCRQKKDEKTLALLYARTQSNVSELRLASYRLTALQDSSRIEASHFFGPTLTKLCFFFVMLPYLFFWDSISGLTPLHTERARRYTCLFIVEL